MHWQSGRQARVFFLGSGMSNHRPFTSTFRKRSIYTTKDVPISFELEKLNVGEAMDLKSGIFTAPRPGFYFFSFTGVYYERILKH